MTKTNRNMNFSGVSGEKYVRCAAFASSFGFRNDYFKGYWYYYFTKVPHEGR